MSKRTPLSKQLAIWYGRKFFELPSNKIRKDVEDRLPVPWDELTPTQRRTGLECWEAQYPTNRDDKNEAKRAFRYGFKQVSVPRRNKRNAKSARPSRQRVSDADIKRVKRDLEAEGVKPHKQCSKAYARLVAVTAPSISLRGFREHWNKLGFNKKGT